MMYLWLAIPLFVSLSVSLVSQFERKRLKQLPLPPNLGEWQPCASREEAGWEERHLVVGSTGLFGEKLILQRRRRDIATGKITELRPDSFIRRVHR